MLSKREIAVKYMVLCREANAFANSISLSIKMKGIV